MEAASAKLVQLLCECEKVGVNPESLDSVKKFTKEQCKSYQKGALRVLFFAVVLVLYFREYLHQSECLVEMPPELHKVFRPPEDCAFCRNVQEIERVSNISPDEFEESYAYSAVPVIVTDATVNWTAPEVFDFWYFKEVYTKARRKRKTLNCQFFPYDSGFTDFFEALEIPASRVNFEPGTDPWYFGWSNCNEEVAEILRQHYTRPYFLPKTSENNPTDWIFMGGPGLGAHMHVDNVNLPSWQAQLRGRKEWILAPPPECYFECSFLRTVVQTGDIFILDTNKWYHQTNVQPGEISITIGAEYD